MAAMYFCRVVFGPAAAVDDEETARYDRRL